MLIFYGHPFSSYTWKALIALYEKDIAFDYRNVDPAFPDHMPELRAHWPVGQFPLIVHDGVPWFETSIIIEYLDRLVSEPRMIPADPDAALKVRFFDRIFDHHVMAQGQHVVNDAIRGPDGHVQSIVDGAATPYGFTLADCAAAPSLFYADWVHRIDEKYENLRAYRARLLAHPSVARCVEEARPYRAYFPLGAPDRD